MDPVPQRQVVVGFPLAEDAVAVLAGRLGRGFAVRDIRAEGPPADLLLAPPCSPQALGRLKRLHPSAAVVVVELEDLLRGIDLGGPVSRVLDAGADAYYVARSTEALGDFLAALPTPAAPALAEQDQPVALPAASAAEGVLARLRERPTREPARRPDPAPGP